MASAWAKRVMKCHEIHRSVARLKNLDVREAHQSMGITWSLCEHVPGVGHMCWAQVTMDHYTVLDHWFGQDVLGVSGSWDLWLLIAWMSPSWSLQRMSGNLAIPWVWRKRLRRNSFESRKMFHLLDELQWSLWSFHLQNTFWLGRMAFFSTFFFVVFSIADSRFKQNPEVLTAVSQGETPIVREIANLAQEVG